MSRYGIQIKRREIIRLAIGFRVDLDVDVVVDYGRLSDRLGTLLRREELAAIVDNAFQRFVVCDRLVKICGMVWVLGEASIFVIAHL